MPKMKSNRGAAKRFKLTGTGKIKRAKAFSQSYPDQKVDETEARPAPGRDGRFRQLQGNQKNSTVHVRQQAIFAEYFQLNILAYSPRACRPMAAG